MIDGRGNHPCIVMWVVFNEGWGQFDTARIVEWSRSYDPTRLVDDASGWNDTRASATFDIHVYPGPGAAEPEREAGRRCSASSAASAWPSRATPGRKRTGATGRREEGRLDAHDTRNLLQRVYELREKPALAPPSTRR